MNGTTSLFQKEGQNSTGTWGLSRGFRSNSIGVRKDSLKTQTNSQGLLLSLVITLLIVTVQGATTVYGQVCDVDVPTDADPSPLFGAQDFSQKMLRFEEFGTHPMPLSECSDCTATLPVPANILSSPDGALLDAFLNQPIHPYPTMESYTTDPNPWKSVIEQYTGPLNQTVYEGRPPGPNFAHQRWAEFFPQEYFQSVQAGARKNRGLRDNTQLHGYAAGEFGPNGLYHNTTGGIGFEGTTDGIQVRFHPNMPIQNPNALWTFDGTFPPKILMARYGVPILFRHFNALPIAFEANFGFGAHTLTTHEHNGHVAAESDGFTQAFFFPGQFYDYHWPMILAGHDSINTNKSELKAGTPDGAGGITKIPGDYRETMSTHWFHDHMLDFTAQNVYKGNVAMLNYYSAIDRGNEAIDDGVNLRFPSGTALDWGNRDYDVNLDVADKAWDQQGQLFFNIFDLDGFLGDRMTVNWLYKPYFEVRARRYRFRILNGSVSRYFRIALIKESGERVPFHMIANDGNIMEHAVYFPNGQLPTQAIAERYDIIVDFSQFQEGDKLYLVNVLEHEDGKNPEREIPLADILSGQYDCDTAVGKFLELRVKSYQGQDLSMNPADYVAGKKKMIPMPTISKEELETARHRTFEFDRDTATDEQPWVIQTDGGMGFGMDPARLSAAPVNGELEIWHLVNGGGGWSHPIHVHFEEARILKRGGEAPPEWEKWARKDVFRIGVMDDSTRSVDIAIRFREFMGTYMEHCHNTQHEDHAMLLRWDIQNPGQTIAIPTPVPTWEGVTYISTNTTDVPTHKTGDVNAAADFFDECPAEELAANTVWTQIVASSDDAEEDGSGGIRLGSNDLDIGIDTIGLRFANVDIPQGATIVNAHVQFQADAENTEATSLTIIGEAADNASTFITNNNNISTRPVTSASVPWSPAPWDMNGESGLNQLTPPLTSIIQEIINRPGWTSGNALALVIDGSGRRTAVSVDSSLTGAPMLDVEYITAPGGGVVNTAPTVVISSPIDLATFAVGSSINFQASATDVEDGDISANLIWTSSIDGNIGNGGAFTSSTLSVGTHTITALTTDSGGLPGSDAITITVNPVGNVVVAEFPVIVGNDDVEEAADGDVEGRSSDLEMTEESSTQTIGLRFQNVNIPQGATVVSAHIQFFADETDDVVTSLDISGKLQTMLLSFSPGSTLMFPRGIERLPQLIGHRLRG